MSATTDFLAYLQSKFGLTLDASDLTFGSGSSVSDASLKAAAASTASTTAATTASTGSSSSNMFGTVASLGGQGAQFYQSHQQSVQNKAAQAQNEAQQKTYQAQQQASNAQQQTSITDGKIGQLKSAITNTVNTQENLTDKYQAAVEASNDATARAQALQQTVDGGINTQTGKPLTIAETDQYNKAIDSAWKSVENSDTAASRYDAQLDQQNIILTNQRNELTKLGGSDWTQTDTNIPLNQDPNALFDREVAAGIDPDIAGADAASIIDSNPSVINAIKNSIVPPGGTQISNPIGTINSTLPEIQPVKLTVGSYINFALVAGAGFGLYESVKSLANHFSITGLLGAGTSAYGLWRSLSGLHSLFTNILGKTNGLFSSMPWLQNFMHFATSTPGILIIVAAIVLIALLLGVTANTTPSAAEYPLVSMPTVWTSGPVMFMTAGIALAAAGIGLGPTASTIQTVTVPTIQLQSALASAGLTDTSGNAVAANGYSTNGTVFVSQGTGAGGADQVVYITPGANGQSVAHVTTLKAGLKFAAPSGPNSLYINFFNGNSANPNASVGLQSSVALAKAAAALGNTAGATALEMSGAANKGAGSSGNGASK